MEKQVETYKPSELAHLFSLHSNTIRFYESMGFISKADRGENGYRQYSRKHLLQLKIVRYIFVYPYTNYQIRSRGSELIKEVAEGNLAGGMQYAKEYIACINEELKKAEDTALILSNWAMQKLIKTDDTAVNYTRRQMADLLGTTVEAIRNWERNNLIQTRQRGANHEVLFESSDIERMKIIYMLRQSGYSMSAIHRCLALYDKGKREGLDIVLNENEQGELLSAGDCWVEQLKKVKIAAEKIPPIIEEIKKLEN